MSNDEPSGRKEGTRPAIDVRDRGLSAEAGESALVAELRRLELGRRTGVLRAGDGSFHVCDGFVSFAQSPRTAGLDQLLAASGTPGARAWWHARRGGTAGDATAVMPDGLSRADAVHLEAWALLAMFDAAYFLLDSTAPARFAGGPPHPLADVCRIAPVTLLHECARRRRQPAAGWPTASVDRAPVVPVRRVRRQRVVLTGAEAEVLLNADGRRTVVDLARDLGRTTYGCLLAVRALTAAGLVSPQSSAEPGPSSLPQWAPVDVTMLGRLRDALKELA